jgi:hypothetical protein
MEIVDSMNIMKALADSSRLMILNALMEESQCVEELAERCGLAASTVSFHLRKLEQARLVSKRKEQYYAIFSANEQVLNLTVRELTSFRNIDKFIQAERVEKYRRKVIRAFFRGTRLLRLPAQHKKRLIVLREFAARFTPGILYDEKAVNETIARSFEDYCTVRRELIEEGFMSRKDHKYHLREEFLGQAKTTEN